MRALPIDEIVESLRCAEQGEKDLVMKRYASLFNCSRDTIYRQLRLVQGKKKTLKREKKIPDALIHEAAKIKRGGERLHLAEREISSEIVITMLREKQVEGADQLSVSTLNRRLNERGYRERAPFVFVEGVYSNQQHGLDFSRSKYFQTVHYDAVKNDYVLRVSGKELHYKLEDGKTRLRTWIVSLVDVYSRVCFRQAYTARAEDISLGLEHLRTAYEGEFNFGGLARFYLPSSLKTDNGAFAKNGAVKRMLEALEIKSELAAPEEHRGNQKVEASFRAYWQRFELPLAYKLGNGATIMLSEYNDLAREFAISEALRKHPVRQQARMDVYRAGLASREQRTIKQDLRDVAFKVLERTVSDALLVTIENEKFEAPRYAMGKRIKIYATLNGDYAGEMVADGDYKTFILKRVDGFVELGNFEHRPHATYKQQIDTEIKADKIKYMKPREKGVVVQTAKMKAEQFASVDEARKSLLDAIYPYSFDMGVINGFLEQTLDKEEISGFIDSIRQLKSADKKIQGAI